MTKKNVIIGVAVGTVIASGVAALIIKYIRRKKYFVYDFDDDFDDYLEDFMDEDEDDDDFESDR